VKGKAIWALIALFGLAVAVREAAGGVYNFAEGRDVLRDRTNLLNYRGQLLTLRDLAFAGPMRWRDPAKVIPGKDRRTSEPPLTQRYLLVMRLVEEEPWDKLTLEQKLNVSAYLIHCGRTFEARELLEAMADKEEDNFLILANLATTYFQLGELRRATEIQKMVLKAWPERFADVEAKKMKPFLDRIAMGQPDFEFFRKAETFWMDLMTARLAEEQKGLKGWSEVDAIFKGSDGRPVRFVNAKGEFQPGKLAPEEEKKLPGDALEIVQQMLLWRPTDNRLLYLYGLLLAAKNEIKEAKWVFGPDLAKLVETKEFREQKFILDRTPDPGARVDTNIDVAEKTMDIIEGKSAPYPYRDVVLWCLVGIAVGVFGSWQFREIRRRHQRPALDTGAKQNSSTGGAP
jgi:tetratricopeptide (TPR) repeat protein